MRILYHHRTQAGDAQGIHIRQLIRGFRRLNHELEEVALVHAEGSTSEGTDAASSRSRRGLNWLRGKLPDLLRELAEVAYNLVGTYKLQRAARRFKPDFIYERYALFNVSGVLVARWHGVPLVLEVNSPLALEQRQLGQQRLSALASRLERWICNHATVVIAVSTPLREMLVAAGVEPERIVVMSNGVDPSQFQPDRQAAARVRARLGLSDARVIGFAGWMRDWHGIAELVSAMPHWPAALHDVRLLLIGDGPAREAIEAATREANVQQRVHITGALSHAEVVEHLAAIDLAVQPAATPYASPMKIFEYLAMGKPVIAVDQANTREILVEGYNALFFPPGDMEAMAEVLSRALEDPLLLRAMSRSARDSILQRGFLWERNAQRVVERVADLIREERVAT